MGGSSRDPYLVRRAPPLSRPIILDVPWYLRLPLHPLSHEGPPSLKLDSRFLLTHDRFATPLSSFVHVAHTPTFRESHRPHTHPLQPPPRSAAVGLPPPSTGSRSRS